MSHAETLPGLRDWPSHIEPVTRNGRRVYPIPDNKIESLRDAGVKPLGICIDHASVTTVIDSQMGLWGRFLNDWYAKTERAAVLEAVSKQFEWASGMTGEAFVAAVEKGIGPAKAANRAKEAAGDIGTEVHKAIQARLREQLGLPYVMPKLGDHAQLGFMAWEDWWNESGYKPIRVEQVLWDESDLTAGQLDLIAEGQEGQLVLLDWKSSNYIVAKHHVQVAKYLQMLRRWRPATTAKIVRLPKTLANIQIEVRELGEMYDPEQKKEFRLSEQDLVQSFDALRALYRIFLERR